MADNEGIELSPVLPGIVFETIATNQHLPTIRKLAEAAGFEPAVVFEATTTFQAVTINRARSRFQLRRTIILESRPTHTSL